MDKKYVVVDINEYTPPSIIIFPGWIEHIVMKKIGNITSAGFIDMDSQVCYGKSVSLDLSHCSPRDDTLLKHLLKT